MPLLFVAILTLVIIIPILWKERIDWGPALRLQLLVVLGAAGFGLLIHGVGTVVSETHHFLKGLLTLIALVIGVGSAGFLAFSIAESMDRRSKTVNQEPPPEPSPEKSPNETADTPVNPTDEMPRSGADTPEPSSKEEQTS